MSRSAPEPDSPEPNAVGALKPLVPHPSTASSALEEPGLRAGLPRIPDHELLRPIGRGAYGEVWLARNKLGTLRAVKIVYRKTFEDARPFEREFKGIQKFEPISRSHEGLVDILQVGGTDEYFYYVMELADDGGEMKKEEGRMKNDSSPPDDISVSSFNLQPSYFPKTLRSEVNQRGRLSVDESERLGLALTSALEYLHGQGLVHRDIKPSNIIFVNGVPKLADIGLVAGMDEARSYVGTEGYIPPEGPGKPQADLYSLGKVLYEISTGKDRSVFPEPLTLLGELPDKSRLLELNAVIHKACHSDPKQRYRSAHEMHDDLALLQRGQSVRNRRLRRERAVLASKTFVAVTVACAAWFIFTRFNFSTIQRPTTPPPAASIFVLPFRNAGTNGIDDDLRGRITDAFIDALPLINGVKTGPRKSGWVHRNEDELRHSLAKTNDMRHILTGRIDGSDDTLTLTLRFYETRKNQPLWTEKFSGKRNEAVALESRAIQQITSKLGLRITEEEGRQIGQTLTNNLEALDLYGQARALYTLNGGTPTVFNQAMKLAQRARDLDPHYLDADAFIAYILRLIAQDRAPVEIIPTLQLRTDEILSKDDTHCAALDQRAGCSLFLKWDWVTFDAYYDRLFESVSGQNWHSFRAFWLRIHGRFSEARAEQEMTEHPEPTDPDIRYLMASSRWATRHYDEGVQIARGTLKLYPGHADGYLWLAHCLIGMGDYEQGIVAIQKAQETWKKQEFKALLGYAYARMRQPEEAREVVKELLQLEHTSQYLQPYFIARVYAAMGEKKEALDWLERAAEDRSEYLMIPDWGGLRTDPAWDNLQDEPRYWKLCARLGLGKDQWRGDR